MVPDIFQSFFKSFSCKHLGHKLIAEVTEWGSFLNQPWKLFLRNCGTVFAKLSQLVRHAGLQRKWNQSIVFLRRVESNGGLNLDSSFFSTARCSSSRNSLRVSPIHPSSPHFAYSGATSSFDGIFFSRDRPLFPPLKAMALLVFFVRGTLARAQAQQGLISFDFKHHS